MCLTTCRRVFSSSSFCSLSSRLLVGVDPRLAGIVEVTGGLGIRNRYFLVVFQSSIGHVIHTASRFLDVFFGICWRQVKADMFSEFGLYFVHADGIFAENYFAAPYKPL